MQRNFRALIGAASIVFSFLCWLIPTSAEATDVQPGQTVIVDVAEAHRWVDSCITYSATITTQPQYGVAQLVYVSGPTDANGCPADTWQLVYTAAANAPAGASDYIGMAWASQSDEFITIVGGVDTAKSNGAPDCPSALKGDPINGATGNNLQTEIDFMGGAATGLSLSRTYNSQDNSAASGIPTTFGSNWRGNWQSVLTVLNSGAKIQALRPSGRVETFTRNDNTGLYVSDADVRTRLRVIASGWRLDACVNDQSEYYGADGHLAKIVAPSGQTTRLAYDTNGLLVRVIGPFGHRLSFTNDGNGRVSRVTAPDGGAYQYAYDANNNLASVTYPDGRTRRYVYENAGLPNSLTGIIDENGARFATFVYQADGKAISSEHAGGVERTVFAYNADGTTSITSALGATQTYAFSLQFGIYKPSMVSGTPDPSTGGRAFSYNGRGYLSRRVDWDGHVTRYTLDGRGNETSRTEAAGTGVERVTTTTWHAQYDLPLQRTEPGRVTSYGYDGNGNLLSKTITAGSLTRSYAYAYNALGQVLTATDPSNAVTTYAYDASGNLATATDALGHATTYTNYDGAGRLTRVVDPNGVVSTFAYDPRGRLTRTTLDAEGASPATTTIDYDGVGQIKKITQPNGVFETYDYDAAHRLTTVTNAAGETINYTRDLASNVTLVEFKSADGTTTYSRTQQFDPVGRMISRIGALSQSYQFTYDNNTNLIKVVDPRAKTHRYTYDALDRLATDRDEEANTVTLTRDWTDAVTGYQDARGLTTTYGQNGFGEATGETSPDRGAITYQRDVRGLVTKMTDARGQDTNYGYDALGRLVGKSYTNSAWSQSFVWDGAQPNAVGRLVSLSDENGSLSRQFDPKGRITAESRTAPTFLLSTQYAYDAAGNVTAMMYPSGRIVTYARDAAGRISGITTQQNSSAPSQTIVSGVNWQPYGPLAGMSFGNGLQTLFSTDTDYRITQVQTGPAAAPSVINRTLAWTGDVVDSIDDAINPGRSERLSYTPTRRLSRAKGMYGLLAWTYDANGNRATATGADGVVSTYSYPADSSRLDSVTPAGGTPRSFAYDASGDIVGDTQGLSFEYDGERRLSKAYQTGAPSNVATYGYDALNRLVSRAVSNGATTTTTYYIHDQSNHIIAETDATGATQREYIWLNDLPVAGVANVNTANPISYYVHTDHLGRPVRMTSPSGGISWWAVYSAFGAVHATGGALSQDMRFPGQWFQIETGLAYNWNRHYDATLGRYVQPDPIGYAGGRSLYGYVGGNPLSLIDPTGRCFGPFTYVCAAYGYEITVATIAVAEAALAYYTGGPSPTSFVGTISSEAGALGAEGICRNTIPPTLARVVPNGVNARTLGRPGAADVFVTASEDIAGMNSAQIAQRLTIPESPTGYKVIEFSTPSEGLASPVFRADRGFVGGGYTAGGAREFVVPNGQIPSNATITNIP